MCLILSQKGFLSHKNLLSLKNNSLFKIMLIPLHHIHLHNFIPTLDIDSFLESVALVHISKETNFCATPQEDMITTSLSTTQSSVPTYSTITRSPPSPSSYSTSTLPMSSHHQFCKTFMSSQPFHRDLHLHLLRKWSSLQVLIILFHNFCPIIIFLLLIKPSTLTSLFSKNPQFFHMKLQIQSGKMPCNMKL